MDDSPEPVLEFQQKFNMNYTIVMGNAKLGELYGGILGLPVAFLIGPDGRVYSKHLGATDASVFEKEIVSLLRTKSGSLWLFCPESSSPVRTTQISRIFSRMDARISFDVM